jgi:hypothetical protein
VYPGVGVVHSRVRVGSRSIGAILAVCVVALIIAPLWLVTFGRPPATFNEVLMLGAGFAFFAIIGWWAGRAAADRDWSQAVFTGFGLGVGWGPMGFAVAVIAFLVAIPLRGGQVGSLEEWLWGFSIVAVMIAPAALVGIPNGIGWAIATHWAATRSGSLPREPRRHHASLIALGALFVLAIATGTVLAVTTPAGQ